jgi:hypothetical protein
MFLDFDHLMKVLDFSLFSFLCIPFNYYLTINLAISFNANRTNFAIITLDILLITLLNMFLIFFFIKSTIHLHKQHLSL